MVLKLFSNCIPTRGVSRSVICDLQREQVHLIPNSLYELFDADGIIDPQNVLEVSEEDEILVFNEYIGFLLENELAFYCEREDVAKFPPMSLEWDFPAHISHCVIDENGRSENFSQRILSDLEELCCNYLQLRFYDFVPIERISAVLKLISNSQIKAVDLILKYQGDESYITQVSGLVKECGKIRCTTFHSADCNNLMQPENYGFGIVVKVSQPITHHFNCGIIKPVFFTSNIETFSESQHYNSCLNRKLGIDVNGEIKNCPAMKESFGNIADTSLVAAVGKAGFKDLWFISKDRIDVCNTCEFRYVCTDCRAIVEAPDDTYSKPLKCGYNPETCEWEDWATNPLKQQAIEYYGASNLR